MNYNINFNEKKFLNFFFLNTHNNNNNYYYYYIKNIKFKIFFKKLLYFIYKIKFSFSKFIEANELRITITN